MNRKIVYKGIRFNVVQENHTIGAKTRLYENIIKNDAVGILLHHNKKLLLIKIKRPLIESDSYEIVGGKIEKGELPIDAAKREVLEEVGIDLQQIKHILSMKTMPSLTNEVLHLFEAKINPENLIKIQSDEGILDYEYFDIHKAIQLIEKGKILNIADAFAIMLFNNLNK